MFHINLPDAKQTGLTGDFTRDLAEKENEESSSPLLGDDPALSFPGVLEVAAELVPEHEDVACGHVLLAGLWSHPEVAHRLLETAGETEWRHNENFFGSKNVKVCE